MSHPSAIALDGQDPGIGSRSSITAADAWQESWLAQARLLPHDAAVDAFDGAGKPYKGPSFRGGLTMVAVVIVGVVLSWLVVSAALDMLPGSNSPPANYPAQEPP